MKRVATMLALAGLALGLGACQGDTDPATHVQAFSAQLNAHGRTDDGPATWWWEYALTRQTLDAGNGTEVCGTEADGRCGPASSSSEVKLSTVLRGLSLDTTYFVRACGQDVNDSAQSCGRTVAFRTSRGNSSALVDGSTIRFVAAPGTIQSLRVSRFTDTDGVSKYKLTDIGADDVNSIVPGAGCTVFSTTQTRDNAVKCTASGITRIHATLNDGEDSATVESSVTIGATLLGGTQQDDLTGSSGPDLLNGGPGVNDDFTGGAGNDQIEARDAQVDGTFSCGESGGSTVDRDVVFADAVDPVTSSTTNCEVVNR